MNQFLENSYLILTVGVLSFAVFGYFFVNTRKKIALVGMGAVLVLTLTGLAMEHFIETPREQIEASLEKLSDELEANNIEGVLACLDPTCTKGREEARRGMEHFRITKAKVSKLTIVVNESTAPPSAEVKFTGMVGGVARSGAFEQRPLPVQFTAKLNQHGDRWLVAEYSYTMGIRGD